MKPEKRIITIIIFISAALIGLISLQIYLFHHALKLETESFNNVVENCLHDIVKRLEMREIADNITVKLDASSTDFDTQGNDSLNLTRIFITKDSTQNVMGESTKVMMQIITDFSQISSDTAHKTSAAVKKMYYFPNNASNKTTSGSYPGEPDSIDYMIKTKISGQPFQQSKQAKQQLVEKVMQDLIIKPKPVFERIQLTSLDSLISTTFQKYKIDTPYNYAIINTKTDSVLYKKHKNIHLKNPYHIKLFPNDFFQPSEDLVVSFTHKNIFLLRQTGIWIISSFVFILIIFFCFLYVLKIVYKQKSFAALLVHFINNMTHEFKTPISTIALAGESLGHPAVQQQKNKTKQYLEIIKTETTRMEQHVEKILQLAEFENNDIDLDLKPLDIHKLITQAAKSFELQLKKNPGAITLSLEAPDTLIYADPVHIENVLFNLLDNAVKYNQQNPKIRITTANSENNVLIKISDNGIGIPVEYQKQIFDSYFRVPTGNIHNVKGFGLGLSYVKLILQAHKGSVKVKSQPGKGTVFEIMLPLYNEINDATKH